MKIILLKDVKNQGKKDDIIDVSDGYANNYLLKNKLGVRYSETSKKILDSQIKERQDNEDALVKRLNEIKNKLKDTIIDFKVKTGEQDKMFGSISSKQISDELNKKGFKIDKKTIFIKTPIDSLGVHKVQIKLHKKVEFNINISVKK